MAPGEIGLGLEVDQRVVIGDHFELDPFKVAAPHFKSVNDRPQLLLRGGPLDLRWSKLPAFISKSTAFLEQDRANPSNGSVTDAIYIYRT